MATENATPVNSEVPTSVDYRELAVTVLTFLVPPAAIALRQSKEEQIIDSRHLGVSLALFFSFVFYVPAVAHAYWLLNIRDNGGLESWLGEKKQSSMEFLNTHGPVIKSKVEEYAPRIAQTGERVHTYTTEKVAYVVDKKDKVVAAVKPVYDVVKETATDAVEAYNSGTTYDWIKEKVHNGVQKVKSYLDGWPRLQAVFEYFEQRVPQVLEMIGKLLESIRAKLPRRPINVLPTPSSSKNSIDTETSMSSTVTNGDILTGIPRPDEEETQADVHPLNDMPEIPSPTTPEYNYETAEDMTLDESFNENEHSQENEYSQEL